jgi:hypothetical protein
VLWRLAILLVAAVAAAPTIIAIVAANSSVDALARVPLPEGGLVTLAHPGGNVIYYEGGGSGSPATASYVPPISLRITPVSAGAAVAGLAATSPGRSRGSYSIGGHHGVEAFTVQVTHPGEFRISDSGPAGPVAGTDLAIGPGVSASLFLGILATILIVVCGIGAMAAFIFLRARRKFGPTRGAYPGARQFPVP